MFAYLPFYFISVYHSVLLCKKYVYYCELEIIFIITATNLH